jgi:hypothetical protein
MTRSSLLESKSYNRDSDARKFTDSFSMLSIESRDIRDLRTSKNKSAYPQKNYRTNKKKLKTNTLSIPECFIRKVGSDGDFVEIEPIFLTNQKLLWKENFLIKPYFKYSPEERIKLSKAFARHVDSVEDVLFILKCGNSREMKEGFDSAIALVAECDATLLSETVNWLRNLFIYDVEKARKYEYSWDILILGIACASHLSSAQKLKLFLSLFVNSLGRATKATLIDSLKMLEEEIDSELIKISLERFVSSNELDTYIRYYAQEAIDDLS